MTIPIRRRLRERPLPTLRVLGIALLSLFAGLPAPFLMGTAGTSGRVATFTDVTVQAGLQNLNAIGDPLHPPSAGDYPTFVDWLYVLDMWGGSAWGDYDGDGYEDVYLSNDGRNSLMRNNGDGTFTDVTAATGTGVVGRNYGGTWADYDNDGDLDIFTTSFWSAHSLMRNNGDGTFTNVTAAAGVTGRGKGATGASWADYDNDGDIDLFIPEYLAMPDQLYQNNGDGTFTDATDAAGVGDGGYGFQSIWMDYDLDEDPDIWIVNDFGPDSLYRNNGDGTFANATTESHISGGAAGGMGGTTGDMDNDGDPDAYVTNFRSNIFWNNMGTGIFTDVTSQTKTGDTNVGWGTNTLDYDLDGDLDLFVANGLITTGTHAGAQPNLLYRNDGGLKYTEVGSALNIADTHVARGSSVCDYDNDGDPDVYVVNLDARSVLERNDAATGNSLQILLRGTLSNTFGVGALVHVTVGAVTQTREVQAGSAYLSMNSLVQTFGLGSSTQADSVLVHWPDGSETTLTNVSAGQRLTVVEPVPGIIARAGPDRQINEDTDLTLDASGTLFPGGDPGSATYQWTIDRLGGPENITGKTVVTSFPDPWRTRVTLTVRDGLGNVDTDPMTVRVIDRTSPVAEAGAAEQFVKQGDELRLSGAASTDNDPNFPVGAEFAWTVETRGAPVTLYGATVYPRFIYAGDYDVVLNLSDPAGNWDTDSLVVHVADTSPPKVSAGLPRTVDEDFPVVLSANLSGDNDPDFALTGTFVWAVRSPSGAQLPAPPRGYNVTYAFPEPGAFILSLAATDAAGNTGFNETGITVRDRTPPVIDAGLDRSWPEDQVDILDSRGNVTDNDPGFPDGSMTRWLLQVPDASAPDGLRLVELSGRVTSFTFPQPGVATVMLEVTDAAGNTANDSYSLTILDRTAPVLELGSDITVSEDTGIVIVPTVSDNDPAFVATGRFAWTVEQDGTEATVDAPELRWTFPTPGVATITLTVTDAGGQTQSDGLRITVLDHTPPVVRAPSDLTVAVNTDIPLSAAQTTDNDPGFPGTGRFTWTWNVKGQVVTKAGMNITAQFPQAGSTTVSLRVDDAAGNSARGAFTVTVLGTVKPPDHPPGDNTTNRTPLTVPDPTGPGIVYAPVLYIGLLVAIAAVLALARREGRPGTTTVERRAAPPESRERRRTNRRKGGKRDGSG